MSTIPEILAIGLQHHRAGRLEQAEAIYRQILQVAPDHPDALHFLGLIAHQVGQFDAAIRYLEQAIARVSQSAELQNSLGVACRSKGKLEEAAGHLRQALALKPSYADAHYHLGLALLLSGNLARGFIEHEWRWQSETFRRGSREDQRPALPKSFWNGAELNGQTILLHSEQGLGDTIQFIRYAPLVARRGGRVIVMCQPEVRSLLESVPGVSKVIQWGDPLPEFDVRVPLLSLPRLFGTTLATIPAQIPYIGLPAPARLRLPAPLGPGMRVGLGWAGSPGHKRDRARSCPLAHFRPLLDLPGIAWISLQKGPSAPELGGLRLDARVLDVSAQLGDFVDTATIVAQLDLVISVDTAVVHLAGALGKPVWTLLPFLPDWRWSLDREDSPWYPTMRLFRQSAPGDWEEVFARVADALRCSVEVIGT
jgi:hypothetical protein